MVPVIWSSDAEQREDVALPVLNRAGDVSLAALIDSQNILNWKAPTRIIECNYSLSNRDPGMQLRAGC